MLNIHLRINEVVPFLTSYMEMNSKQIQDLNVRAGIARLLEESIGVNFHHLGFGREFLHGTPKA